MKTKKEKQFIVLLLWLFDNAIQKVVYDWCTTKFLFIYKMYKLWEIK